VRLIAIISVGLAAAAQPRGMVTVIPALDYGPACTSSIEAVNLAGHEVEAEFEGHKESGALVLLEGQREASVRIPPRGKAAFKLRVENEEGAGWVRIREAAGPALAISAAVECVDGDRLLTAGRDVAFPMRRPWFAGEVGELPGAVLTVINISGRPARLAACYSAGNLYSYGGPELLPLCSATLDLAMPPFGTRRVPVEHGGNAWFSLRTWGDAVVLEVLRPLAPRVKLYKVDSTIQFGQEVAPAK
jgi:hypothetical protein